MVYILGLYTFDCPCMQYGALFICIPTLSAAVLGWFNGTELSVREQTEPITLEIGFIKGARFEQFTQLDRLRQLQFTISITPGTASA